MINLITHKIHCPYCGEPIEIVVDCSIADQEYIEDCQVCCRPIILKALVSETDEVELLAYTEDDSGY